jgi:hypothetical protein
MKVLLVALLLVLLPFTVPATAQGQNQGVEQRVTALENRLSAVMQQLTTLEQLTERVGILEALTGRVAALEQLFSRVTVLEQRTQSTFNVSVNCGGGETIGAALAQTRAHTGLVVITVSGECTENVDVTRGQTVIRAASSGATITAANPALPVIRLLNAGSTRFLSLSGPLTIGGGSIGVVADGGTQVQLNGVVVTGNARSGVTGNHRSIVRLANTIVAGNGLGVDVQSGAQVSVTGGSIRDNNDYGLQLMTGAVADVTGGAEITLNRGGAPGATSIRGAVGLYTGSVLRLGNAKVIDNTGNGLFVAVGSVVWLEDGAVISRNGGHGISLSDGGVVGKFFVATGIQISDNGAWGISCSAAPGVAQLYGFPPTASPITTTGNALGGINCPTSPRP